MNIELWPKWTRWLLFLPAASLAIVVMHLGLTLGLSGNEDQISVFGIGIEGSGARWIGTIWREGLMRFLEPWAFVAAAGIIAPARKVPAISAAAAISLLFVALLGIQLNRGGPGLEPAARAVEHVQIVAVILHRWYATSPREAAAWLESESRMKPLAALVTTLQTQ